MPRSPLLSIQYLRGFAALAVVFYHAFRWSPVPFDIGAAGVDIFFVVSGFILWTINEERPSSAGVFLARRWLRIAPLYWLLTIAVAVTALVKPGFFYDVVFSWPHLLQSLGFVPHLNQKGLPFPIIAPGWSLNYEAIYYLVFALSLLAPARWRFMALAAGLSALPLIGWGHHLMGGGPDGLYFLGANAMALQFLAGAAIARLRFSGWLPGPAWGHGMIVWALGAYGVMATMNLYEDLWRPLYWGLPAAALTAGLVIVEDREGLGRSRLLRLLGDASYSIYLVHILTIELLSKVLYTDHLLFVPIAVTVSLIAGLGCHFAVERPMLALGQRLLPSSAQ